MAHDNEELARGDTGAVLWGFCWTMIAALLVSACSAQQATRPLMAPAPDSPIAIVGTPGSVAIGEVNGDGKPDVLVAGARGITVLLGRGDGRFRAAPGSPVKVPDTATEMVLGDFSGDGKLDLALANHDSYGVMRPLRRWQRRLRPRTPFPRDHEGRPAPAYARPPCRRPERRRHA